MGPLVPPGPNSHHSLPAVLAFKTVSWGREEYLGAQKKCTSSCALTALLLDSFSAGFGRVGREASHLVFDLTTLNASPVAWH